MWVMLLLVRGRAASPEIRMSFPSLPGACDFNVLTVRLQGPQMSRRQWASTVTERPGTKALTPVCFEKSQGLEKLLGPSRSWQPCPLPEYRFNHFLFAKLGSALVTRSQAPNGGKKGMGSEYRFTASLFLQ